MRNLKAYYCSLVLRAVLPLLDPTASPLLLVCSKGMPNLCTALSHVNGKMQLGMAQNKSPIM